jgi:signal transduction histidine kinase
VVDHGTGISRTTRHKLFEPFFTTKGNTGTGLGLWLTKDIIDRHQGLIQVRNHSHPRGAVFSIWIPEKPVESNGTQSQPYRGSTRVDADQEQKKLATD